MVFFFLNQNTYLVDLAGYFGQLYTITFDNIKYTYNEYNFLTVVLEWLHKLTTTQNPIFPFLFPSPSVNPMLWTNLLYLWFTTVFFFSALLNLFS